MSVYERNCYTTDITSGDFNLTSKQFLVYLHLLSKSKWNYHGEKHYYIYKKDIQPYVFCKEIKISAPTYISALDKLVERGILKDFENYYLIKFSQYYIPLPTKTISGLLNWGKNTAFKGYLCSIFAGYINFLFIAKR